MCKVTLLQCHILQQLVRTLILVVSWVDEMVYPLCQVILEHMQQSCKTLTVLQQVLTGHPLPLS